MRDISGCARLLDRGHSFLWHDHIADRFHYTLREASESRNLTCQEVRYGTHGSPLRRAERYCIPATITFVSELALLVAGWVAHEGEKELEQELVVVLRKVTKFPLDSGFLGHGAVASGATDQIVALSSYSFEPGGRAKCCCGFRQRDCGGCSQVFGFSSFRLLMHAHSQATVDETHAPRLKMVEGFARHLSLHYRVDVHMRE